MRFFFPRKRPISRILGRERPGDREVSTGEEERERGWVDALPEGSDPERPLSSKLAHEYALVLTARGVEHLLTRSGRGFHVLVRPGELERAVRELSLYVDENRGGRPVVVRAPAKGDAWVGFLSVALLLVFYSITVALIPSLGLYPYKWLELGAVEGGAIMDGQWWRLVTALTLHADPAHVLGNVVIGGAFIMVASRELGPGLALLATVASGALGNLVNVLVQGATHSSVGFSTAVFGTAGVLAAVRAVVGSHMAGGSKYVPIVAGLSLLALLGVGGERTDIGAHIFGFLAGLALGAGIGLGVRRGGHPGRFWQLLMMAAALALPTAAWLWAWDSLG